MTHFKLTSKKKINFNVQLNEEQKEAKNSIIHNQITIITGKAGTGKTLTTVSSALDLLFRKEVTKVFITRPLVTIGKSIGYLPGELDSKVEPFVDVIKQTMIDAYAGNDKSKADEIEKHFDCGDIEIMPVQFIRGKTIGGHDPQLLILTESQNLDEHEMEAVLTRLGKHGRIIIDGDLRQKDIKNKSGLNLALELSKNIEEIKHHHLTVNHRSGVVKKILDFIEK